MLLSSMCGVAKSPNSFKNDLHFRETWFAGLPPVCFFVLRALVLGGQLLLGSASSAVHMYRLYRFHPKYFYDFLVNNRCAYARRSVQDEPSSKTRCFGFGHQRFVRGQRGSVPSVASTTIVAYIVHAL